MDETASFGYLVRRRRKALDLTQAELAHLVGCVVVTIKKIETDVRRPSRQMAERLATFLRIPDHERELFLQVARGEQSPLRVALPLRPIERDRSLSDALATTLIGREAELAALLALVAQPDVRLLTLCGTGGIGKTQLALNLVAQVRKRAQFRDGVVVVALAPLQSHTQLVSTIAHAVGLSTGGTQPLDERLRDYLRNRQLLLVLDNFEHLIEAAPQIGDLVAAAPACKFLVTSRAQLRLSAEHIFPVPPLAVPPEHTRESLLQYAAVRLFVERMAPQPLAATLNDDDLVSIAAICQRLDGLPLAIELAAARTNILAPQDLFARLDLPLELLRGGSRDIPARQQTLRATIAWSYRLLGPAEQQLLARLGVFVGGCTLNAAEAIARVPLGTAPALDLIDTLVSQSLLTVITERGGARRLVLLELIRAFALEQLAHSGEEAVIRRWHAEYYLALAEHAAPELSRPQAGHWMDRLEQEYANLRAALHWSLTPQGDPAYGLRIAVAIWWFWELRGYRREGRAWLNDLLAATMARPLHARAFALHAAAYMAINDGEYPLAERLLTACQQEAEACGQQQVLAMVGCARGAMAGWRSATALACTHLEESRRLFQAAGDRAGEARVCWLMGATVEVQGPAAERWFAEALILAREAANPQCEAMALQGLGDVALERRDVATAERFFAASLDLCIRLGDQRTMGYQIRFLGEVALACGDLAVARTRFAQSLESFQRQGETMGIARSLQFLARLALVEADAHGAIQVLEESLAVFSQGYPRHRAWAQGMLGQAHEACGDLALAEQRYHLSAALFATVDDVLGCAWVQENLGHLALQRGERAQALQLLRASLRTYRRIGHGCGVRSCLTDLAHLAEQEGREMRGTRLRTILSALEPQGCPHLERFACRLQ